MIKTVFLDMDGVLTDFQKAICEKFDIPHPPQIYNFFESVRTQVNDICTIDFWASLEWMYDGKEIFSKVIDFCGINNIYLLTVSMPNPGSGTGKILWVEKHIPTLIKHLIITQAPKNLLAKPDALLIDDKDENVIEFRRAGGQAILVPRAWNSLYNQANKSLEIVKQSLEKICQKC